MADLSLRIILQSPPPGVDFGVQHGSGSVYQTIGRQRSGKGDLVFDFTLQAAQGKDLLPNFKGPVVQGPPGGRFVYIDIGATAGQVNAPWSRRLKIPLVNITWKQVDECLVKGHLLQAVVPGTGKDGGPTCGTIKPFSGWQTVQ